MGRISRTAWARVPPLCAAELRFASLLDIYFISLRAMHEDGRDKYRNISPYVYKRHRFALKLSFVGEVVLRATLDPHGLRSAVNAIRKKTRNMKLRDDANLLRLPHKIDVDTLKKHDLEPLRAAVTRRLAS